MKRVAAMTLGCKVNFYETEAMLSLFAERGWEIADFDENADVYIVNTCTVTAISDKKSRQMIRRARSRNPKAVIAAVGCYAQVAPDEVKAVEGLDIVLGVKDKYRIVEEVERYDREKGTVVGVSDISETEGFETVKLSRFSDRQRLFVKIQDGCNNFCTYCIIPYARGRVRSRIPSDVVDEVRIAAENGYKEIVLTGIHLASYGKDLSCTGLAQIIEDIHAVEGIERIRLSSLEPTIVDEDFLGRLSKLPKLCAHFHLSLQSGCDKTLRRMNRRYTAADYEQAANALKSTFTDTALTTDIIVGFPGESEQDFDESMEFARQIGFMKVHVFPFSPKKGTPAAVMPEQIDKGVKDERAKKMLALSDGLTRAYLDRFTGRELGVLVEKAENSILFGHTANYVPVYIDCADNGRLNEIVKVKLTEAGSAFMQGELI